MIDIGERRRVKDEFFARSGDSPLTDEQRGSFAGLHYSPPDARLRFEAQLLRSGDGEHEEIQTNDGQTQHLARAGTIRFEHDGRAIELAAYAQGDELFIPFRDATSGNETYGAGRYVEAHPLGGDRYDLDFNAAYNPYCAYNDSWSCPLPPRANWMDVPIRAGEMSFH